MKLNLDDWIYTCTFGKRADAYAKDNQRAIMDRESKELICLYVFKDNSHNRANNRKGSRVLK